MMQGMQAIVLAAGNSSRFKTDSTKFLEKICGQELILYPLTLLQRLHIPTTLVVGSQKEQIQEKITHTLGNVITYSTQEKNEGTAHALTTSQDLWYQPHVLVMHGDIPLLNETMITQLYKTHTESNADITCVVAHNADPSLTGYDHVTITDKTVTIHTSHHVNKDEFCCVNAGIYLIKRELLELILSDAMPFDQRQECSFAEHINEAGRQGFIVKTMAVPFDTIRGVNTMQDLCTIEYIKRAELIRSWMEAGVRFVQPHTTVIETQVTIGANSTIGAGVQLRGQSTIGTNSTIHEFSCLENSTIGNHTTVLSHSVIKDSQIGNHCMIGPFAHVKEYSLLADQTTVGNFVEVKKSSLGNNTKAKHLTYLGDADIGAGVNIGAGTITCNHNGITKNKTFIEDHAYIGAHTALVAPVTVGKHAMTAAGSVITESVPAHALAIGRARQINKEGYADRIRQTAQEQYPNNAEPTFGTAVKTHNDSSSK